MARQNLDNEILIKETWCNTVDAFRKKHVKHLHENNLARILYKEIDENDKIVKGSRAFEHGSKKHQECIRSERKFRLLENEEKQKLSTFQVFRHTGELVKNLEPSGKTGCPYGHLVDNGIQLGSTIKERIRQILSIIPEDSWKPYKNEGNFAPTKKLLKILADEISKDENLREMFGIPSAVEPGVVEDPPSDAIEYDISTNDQDDESVSTFIAHETNHDFDAEMDDNMFDTNRNELEMERLRHYRQYALLFVISAISPSIWTKFVVLTLTASFMLCSFNQRSHTESMETQYEDEIVRIDYDVFTTGIYEMDVYKPSPLTQIILFLPILLFFICQVNPPDDWNFENFPLSLYFESPFAHV